MAVLVKNGKVRTSGGRVRTGPAGSPCCCGCCKTCDQVRAKSLPTSVSLDLTGVWDVSGCAVTPVACAPSATSVVLPFDDDGDCEDLYFQEWNPVFETPFCLSGYTVGQFSVSWVEAIDGTCGRWFIDIVFVDAIGTQVARFIYSQSTPSCFPIGVYAFDSVVGCPSATGPATVTVS